MKTAIETLEATVTALYEKKAKLLKDANFSIKGFEINSYYIQFEDDDSVYKWSSNITFRNKEFDLSFEVINSSGFFEIRKQLSWSSWSNSWSAEDEEKEYLDKCNKYLSSVQDLIALIGEEKDSTLSLVNEFVAFYRNTIRDINDQIKEMEKAINELVESEKKKEKDNLLIAAKKWQSENPGKIIKFVDGSLYSFSAKRDDFIKLCHEVGRVIAYRYDRSYKITDDALISLYKKFISPVYSVRYNGGTKYFKSDVGGVFVESINDQIDSSIWKEITKDEFKGK